MLLWPGGQRAAWGLALAAWVQISALLLIPSQERSRTGKSVLRAEGDKAGEHLPQGWHTISLYHRVAIIPSIENG